jgi:hypothetical protein
VCLEAAIANLGDGPAERRVRSQFHQLVLALERAGCYSDAQRLLALLPEPSPLKAYFRTRALS